MLADFGHALRDTMGVDLFGVIRVGRFANDDRDLEIIRAQDEICAEDPYFLMLTDEITTLSRMPEYMNPNVAGHLSLRGLDKVGKDAAATLASQV